MKQFGELRGDETFTLAAFFGDTPQFLLIGGEPLAHPCHLAFELTQGVLGGHGLPLGFALLVFEALQQPGQFGDLASQRGDANFFFADGAFEFAHLQQDVAQLALHGERSLAALLAAGDGHVVEALARLREEEGVGIFQRQAAADFGIGNNVAVAKLRQNHFQRLAESVEDTNAVLERNHGIAVSDVMHRLVEVEGKLCLRIFGMNEECGAAIDVGAQQAQTFVGSIPRLHHDIVQLVAQEIIDHMFVAIVDFKKVGQHAGGST